MSSVEITINNFTAALTDPLSIFERETVIDPSASVMSLAGREESVNLPKHGATPFGFILELANKLRPTSITNRLCNAVIRRHALHIQVLGKDSLVLAYQPGTQFMKEIFSLIHYLLVNKSNLNLGFVSVIATFNFTGKTTLKTFQFLFGHSKKLRSCNTLTARRDKERLQAQVNTNLRAGFLHLDTVLNFAKNRCEVFTGRSFRNCDAFHLALYRTMIHGLNRIKFKNIQSGFLGINAKMLGYLKRLSPVFILEFWKLRVLIEKVIICHIKMAQRALKRLGIYISQPNKLRILFKNGEHFVRIKVVQALFLLALIGSIEIYPLTKKMIIDKTAGAKMLCEKFFLAIRRIQSKFMAFIDEHVYNISQKLINGKMKCIPNLCLSRRYDGFSL